MSREAALLDRDGTLNERPPTHDYVKSLDELSFLPRVGEALRTLSESGMQLVLISNQRGVGRGMVSSRTLEEINHALQELARDHGCEFAAFYYCPHLGRDACHCRKPQPGLLYRAKRELDLDLRSSWMVGDSGSDIEAGLRAGTHTALIGDESPTLGAELVAPDLLTASRLIAQRRTLRQASCN